MFILEFYVWSQKLKFKHDNYWNERKYFNDFTTYKTDVKKDCSFISLTEISIKQSMFLLELYTVLHKSMYYIIITDHCVFDQIVIRWLSIILKCFNNIAKVQLFNIYFKFIIFFSYENLKLSTGTKHHCITIDISQAQVFRYISLKYVVAFYHFIS